MVDERDAVGPGNVAVICPSSLVERWPPPSRRPGVEFGIATRDRASTSRSPWCPVGLVKGLEVDASVVVEPAGIVAEEAQGYRALYVALTRSTKRLASCTPEPLPDGVEHGVNPADPGVTRQGWLGTGRRCRIASLLSGPHRGARGAARA